MLARPGLVHSVSICCFRKPAVSPYKYNLGVDGKEIRRRPRAVQLTDSALGRLKSKIQEVHQSQRPGGRLTREARAELMGVSPVTADRILGRKGNDRNVLIDVFLKLELDWTDEDCEPHPSKMHPVTSVAPNPVSKPRRHFAPLLISLSVLVSVPVLVHLATLIASETGAQRYLAERNVAASLIAEGRRAYVQADYSIAREKARQAFSHAQQHAAAEHAAEALTLDGEIFAAQGQLDEALEKYREALSLWQTFGNTHAKATQLEVIAVTEARLGLIDDARQNLLEALDIFRQLGNRDAQTGSLRGLGSIAAVSGDIATARRWYEEASRDLEKRPEKAMQVDLRALSALLLRDEGKYPEALSELESCLDYWQSREHPRWQATTRRQIASVLLLAGEEERALQQITRAIALYEQVGDQLSAAEARRLLSEGRPYIESQAGKIEDYF